MNNDTEPSPDGPLNSPVNEEIVDPSIPEGNSDHVVIKRHPFGIIVIYLETFLGIGAAFGLLYFFVPSLLSGDSKDNALRLVMLIGIFTMALLAIFLLLATSIYRNNSWVITDDSITQVSQTGLFRRQISELSMANIEDVTSEQNGILAELFGFGTLKAETAGERSNFHFIYCPNPNKYAKIILHAREQFIEGNPEDAKRANDLLNVPRT